MHNVLRISLILVALLFSTGLATSGEDRRFEEVRLITCRSILEILVKKGHCSNQNDCVNQQLLFCSPARNGISIQLWGIRDTDTLEEVVSIVGREFVRQRGQMQAKFIAYSIDKGTSLTKHFWEKNDVLFTVNFQGEH